MEIEIIFRVHSSVSRAIILDYNQSGHCELTVQPDPEQREKLLGVHRLRDVVRCSGLKAFLPVAFHRLGGNGDDRDRLEFRDLPYLRIASKPSIPGIMMSIRTPEMPGVLASVSMPSFPFSA